jgi:hypothetical protein
MLRCRPIVVVVSPVRLVLAARLTPRPDEPAVGQTILGGQRIPVLRFMGFPPNADASGDIESCGRNQGALRATIFAEGLHALAVQSRIGEKRSSHASSSCVRVRQGRVAKAPVLVSRTPSTGRSILGVGREPNDSIATTYRCVECRPGRPGSGSGIVMSGRRTHRAGPQFRHPGGAACGPWARDGPDFMDRWQSRIAGAVTPGRVGAEIGRCGSNGRRGTGPAETRRRARPRATKLPRSDCRGRRRRRCSDRALRGSS